MGDSGTSADEKNQNDESEIQDQDAKRASGILGVLARKLIRLGDE